MELSEVIHIGTIGRPHGKQGAIQCRMLNEHWDNADAEFIILMLDGILVPWRVTDWRGKGADTLIMELRGVTTEQQAARLTGTEAYMLRSDMSHTDEESDMTWEDLIGYKVLNQGEGEIGSIQSVDESTMNTLLYLDSGRIIPAHEDLIVALDTDTQQLLMNLPLGL